MHPHSKYTIVHVHNVTMLYNTYRHLRRSFKEEIVRDLLTSTTAQAELEAEWQQLREDRDALRTIFPTGNSKVSKFL